MNIIDVREWTTAAGLPARLRQQQWPDKIRFGFAGLPNAFLGYVQVPADHPWYGEHYNNIEPRVDAHGGLTYSGSWNGNGEWWIGFDCGHWGDTEENCPQSYAEAQCERIAEQITAAAR